MWFGVLGPLEVRDAHGNVVRLLGPARRQLLAALLCRGGRTVPSDVLVADLWGDAPPRSATKTLHSHVARLRDDLGHEAEQVLRTEPLGYRVAVAAADLDAAAFEDLVADTDSDPEVAIRRLDKALALWRGDAYADFGEAAFVVTERVRLAELRTMARERRTDLALELGQAASLVAELEQRVAAEPYRERGWEQLILALYRAGRQADALATYRRAQEVLAAELGVDPGPQLRMLEQQILRQDESLLAPGHRATVTASASEILPSGECPYLGLAAYTEQDATLFAGRERLTSDVVSLLSDNAVVAVVGASGTGKSSLVRAGVVAALRRGALPGSASWRVHIGTPSAFDPDTRDADLIVLDQAEELFTVCDERARGELVAALLNRVDQGRQLILTIRGDFYGRLAELPAVAAYAERATVLVGPMRDDELARVVQQPAARAGVAVDPALLDAVLDEVHGQVGALPMLSAALAAAWDERESGALTLAGYRRGGGVAGAIQASAERVFRSLNAAQQTQARDLLVRLAVRDQAAGWSRRPMETSEARDHASAEVLHSLAGGRLITISGDRVEISHEALLLHWPRLAAWLDERVEVADLLEHVRAAERSWREAGRPDSDLYRGARLHEATERRAAHPDDFSQAEAEFLDASQTFATRELTTARQQAEREAAGRRRLRRVAIALAAVVVVAAAAAGVAVHERGKARHQADRANQAALTADARKVAAEALNAPDLRTSLLLAATAYKMQDSPDTRSGLLSAIERYGAPTYRVASEARLQWVDVSADGKTLWAMDNLRRVYRFDPRTGPQFRNSFPAQADHIVAMSPDSRLLVAVGQSSFLDRDGATRAVVLDATTGELEAVLPISAVQNGTAVRSAAFTGDGRWLAIIEAAKSAPDTPIGEVALFDAHQLTAPPRLLHFTSPVMALAAGRQRLAVQTADGSLTLIDPVTLRHAATGSRPELAVPADQRDDLPSLAMSPDDRYLAVQHATGIELLAATALSVSAPTTATLSTGVTSMSFSPAGDLLAVGTESGEVDVLHVPDGSLAVRETGNTAQVMSVAWSGHAKQDEALVAGGLDSQIIGYDVRQTSRQLAFSGPTEVGTDYLRLAGRYIVGIQPDEGLVAESKVNLWAVDPATHRSRTFPLHMRDDTYISSLSIGPDDRYALLTIQHLDGTITCRVFDFASGRVLSNFRPAQAPNPFWSYQGLISPDGKSAVLSVGRRTLAKVALPSGKQLGRTTIDFRGPLKNSTWAIPLAFAPDGGLLLWGDAHVQNTRETPPGPQNLHRPPPRSPRKHEQYELVDPTTGRNRGSILLGSEDLYGVPAWSRDHRRLALGVDSGTFNLLDALSLRPIAQRVATGALGVDTVAYSPDGRTIVLASSDGELGFFDAATGRRIGPEIRAGDGRAYAWFDQRGDVWGYALNGDGTTQRRFTYPGRPAEWLANACATAGGNLTRDEWARYVTDRPYFRTCS